MSWAFWPKKSQQEMSNPRITFELIGGSRVSVTCDWSEPSTVAEKVEMAKSFASMLHFIDNGQAFPLIVQAVAVTGKMKGEERLTEYMLGVLHVLLKETAKEKEQEKELGQPVVEADEVFSRGQ